MFNAFHYVVRLLKVLSPSDTTQHAWRKVAVVAAVVVVVAVLVVVVVVVIVVVVVFVV